MENKTANDQEAYNELSYYSLAHPDPAFIHQYIVDAYAAQSADATSKPITLAFAVAGLYLHNEKHYSGRQVQEAHIQLAKKKRAWPRFNLPTHRGDMTAADVLRAAPGYERDEAIQKWSASVWEAWHESHAEVANWLKRELRI